MERDQIAAVVVDTLTAAFGGDLGVLEHHPGMTALKAALPRTFAAFTDFTAELKQVLVDGDRVATHWILRARHTGDFFGIPGSDTPVQYQNVSIARVEDGRIVQFNSEVGYLSVLMQIGELPRPSRAEDQEQ